MRSVTTNVPTPANDWQKLLRVLKEMIHPKERKKLRGKRAFSVNKFHKNKCNIVAKFRSGRITKVNW